MPLIKKKKQQLNLLVAWKYPSSKKSLSFVYILAARGASL